MHFCLRSRTAHKRIGLPLHPPLPARLPAPAKRNFSTRYKEIKKRSDKIICHRRSTNIVEILQRIRPQVFLDDICHLHICNGGYQRTPSAGTCYTFFKASASIVRPGNTWSISPWVKLSFSVSLNQVKKLQKKRKDNFTESPACHSIEIGILLYWINNVMHKPCKEE